MNRGRKRMAVFTLILAAVCVAAAWKIGWQRDDIQTPEPGGKVNGEIEASEAGKDTHEIFETGKGDERTEMPEIEETEMAQIPVSGVISRFIFLNSCFGIAYATTASTGSSRIHGRTVR